MSIHHRPVRDRLAGATRSWPSIVFGLLAFIALNSPENDSVATVMVATVALSVARHGLTVRMIGAWYDRRSDGLDRKMLS